MTHFQVYVCRSQARASQAGLGGCGAPRRCTARAARGTANVLETRNGSSSTARNRTHCFSTSAASS